MHYVASLMAKTLIRMFTVWTGDCPTIGCALHLKSAGGASITRREVPALTRNTSHRRTKPATIYCDGCASFRHRKPCYAILRSPDESLLLRVMAQRIVGPLIFIVTDVWVIAKRSMGTQNRIEVARADCTPELSPATETNRLQIRHLRPHPRNPTPVLE